MDLYHTLKDFAGPLATVVASFAAVIVTYRLGREQTLIAGEQARIARDKLRLELYERRWSVFKSIFAFYYAMIGWEGTDEQKAARDRFFMAYQESAFLFDPADEVEAILKGLNDKGRKVMDYREGLYDDFEPKLKSERLQEVSRIQTYDFEEGLAKLRSAMVKYLGFQRVFSDV